MVKYFPNKFCQSISETPKKRKRKQTAQTIAKHFTLHASAQNIKAIAKLLRYTKTQEVENNGNCKAFCVVRKLRK